MVVMKQGASSLFSGQLHVNIRRVREVDVWPAVAIVIDQSHPATHRFHDVFLVRGGKMTEMDAGRSSDIHHLRDRSLRRSMALSGRSRLCSATPGMLSLEAEFE